MIALDVTPARTRPDACCLVATAPTGARFITKTGHLAGATAVLGVVDLHDDPQSIAHVLRRAYDRAMTMTYVQEAAA